MKRLFVSLSCLLILGLLASPVLATPLNYSYQVLNAFSSSSGGKTPDSGLVADSSGNLYGTTASGTSPSASGTLYELTAPTAGSNLYGFSSVVNFASGNAGPQGSLAIDSSGNIYGASSSATYAGSVWKYSAGALTTLVSQATFGSYNGAYGGVTLDPKTGTLYGLLSHTTSSSNLWSSPVSGTTSLTKSGTVSSGAYNTYSAPLEDSSGNFYWTNTATPGSAFEGTAAGQTPTTLLTFTSYSTPYPGSVPKSGFVMDKNGNLFGTTSSGGNGGSNGWGLVYELTAASGYTTEQVLFSFNSDGSTNSGKNPYGALAIDANGNLFGTTTAGGTGSHGTVFELEAAGGYTTFDTLYSFTNESTAYGQLYIDGNGDLIGTTSAGGANSGGVVFELVAPTPEPATMSLLVLGGIGALLRRRKA
jgi:hypothetical protein